LAGTLEIPVVGEANSKADPKLKTGLETLNARLNAENLIGWYKPLSIAAEQTRESTSFGTLTTADEIKSIVVPENGLIKIGYVAKVKSSEANKGRLAIFIGANQMKNATDGLVHEVEAGTGTVFNTITTQPGGLAKISGEAAFPTTGAPLGLGSNGGFCSVFVAAGTYNVSIQYRVQEAAKVVTAKERKLWVGVMVV